MPAVRTLRYKHLFFLLLITNVIAISLLAYRKFNRETPEKFENIYNDLRNDVFSQLPIDTADYVFVGTSMTEGFPFSEYYGSLQFKNRGIFSNNAQHIVDRIQGIDSFINKKAPD